MKIVTSLDCFCVIFRLVVCISFYFQKNKKREKRKQGISYVKGEGKPYKLTFNLSII
jgi:hypothetical protein